MMDIARILAITILILLGAMEGQDILVEESLPIETSDKLEARLEVMQKRSQNRDLRDVSHMTTEELIRRFVFADDASDVAIEFDELQQRELQEVKAEVTLMLEHPALKWISVLNVVKISGLVSDAFKAEVGEYFLFKPGNEFMDSMFLGAFEENGQIEFLTFISSPEIDQTHIIERLVFEGRLEKGTSKAIYFRKQLAGLSEKTKVLRGANSQRFSELESLSENPRSFAWLYWMLGALILSGIGVLVWNGRKGSSAS